MRRKILAGAVAATLTLSVSAPAAAAVYAGSSLEFSNLLIDFFDQDTGQQITDLNPGYTFNVENSATLNGETQAWARSCSSIAGNCSTTSPVLGAPAANAPGSAVTRANNNYSLFGPGTGDYANSNVEITTAQLIDPTGPTSSRQVAESFVDGNGAAQSSTNIQSNSTFTMDFTLVGQGPARLELNFDALPQLRALVDSDGQGFAQTSVEFSFNLRRTDGGSEFLTWSPDGSGGNNAICAGGLSCDNVLNDLDLNLTLGQGPGDGEALHNFGGPASAFRLHASGLNAGSYSLTLAGVTLTNATEVPAPGTLLLMGGGLLGLGLAGIRRRGTKW
ncbi:EDSAP-1 family PEP-CTERM protein [Ectothiorhodospira variabilis]|uniref:EDSAP-1 family PEP-CTERM protein n=1 Tax=Ectothiorhodospira variabilis TaxID=505694 RepID=UPI001EFAA09B|nr:EDSAP-1 family PEP-CTERM protein [Ectothiorhodospira variabilis]MCG5497640.1 PEP-CTERM sorting domain-containing protein [Ectothiorhodospira variabilis]